MRANAAASGSKSGRRAVMLRPEAAAAVATASAAEPTTISGSAPMRIPVRTPRRRGSATRRPRAATAATLLVCGATLLGSATARAQNSSLYHQDLPAVDRQALQLADASWLYQRVDPPSTLKLHDLITIAVNESSTLNSQGEVDRRKTGTYDWQLKNWVKLDGLSLKKAPMNGGAPQANSTLDQEYQANSQLQTKDNLQFKITAEIVDIRPNGNLRGTTLD